MKKPIKRVAFSLILVLAILSSYPGCKKEPPPKPKPKPAPVKKENPYENKVILKIENNPFTNKDFKRFVGIQYPDVAKSTLADNKRLIQRMFESFVDHKVLWFMASQADITVDDLELNHYFNKRLSIASGNIDKKAAKETIKVQKYLFIKVYDGVKVQDKEIRDYYNKNRDEFKKKAQVLLHQILVKNEAEAVKIRGILKNYPRRFEDIARKDSISMEAKNGGLMGYFEKGTLPTDMESVVFSLNTNTISPVVKSHYGYHIFKITKKKKARTLYLKNVKPEIEKKLLSEKLSSAYQQFLAKCKGELLIESFPDNVYIKKLPAEDELQKENQNNATANPTGSGNNATNENNKDNNNENNPGNSNETPGNKE